MDLRHLGASPAQWSHRRRRVSQFRHFQMARTSDAAGHGVCFPGSPHPVSNQRVIVLQRSCFVAAICLFAVAITVRTTGGISPDALQAQTPGTQKTAPPAAQPGYVGSDTCVACHTEGESLKGTPHAQAKNPRTPAATHGCESCHGPGQAHVDDDDERNIRKFGQITPARSTRRA